MELKTKKLIAREVLLFFGTIALSTIFYLSLILYNVYLKNSNARLSETNRMLKTEIDKLPQDQIWKLYGTSINNYMIVKYQVNDDKYEIPKKEENEFLKKFPDAKKLGNSSKRYSISKVKYVALQDKKVQFKTNNELGIKVKRIYPTYSDLSNMELASKILKKYPVQQDSIVVFDFVDIGEFRTLMSDTAYQNKFFDFASRYYDIGTRKEYDKKIEEGLQYNDSIKEKSKELYNELTTNDKQILNNKYSIVDNANFLNYTMRFWLFIIAFLYPIRLISLVLRWSIRTIKK